MKSSVCLPVTLSLNSSGSVSQSLCSFVHLSLSLRLSVSLSLYHSVSLSLCLSVHLPPCPSPPLSLSPSFRLSLCPSLPLSLCLSVFLSLTFLSVSLLPRCLFVHLSYYSLSFYISVLSKKSFTFGALFVE